MKKGFTLIELMIVIIIIGVLATIGIVQYQAAVEKSRGAEAKQFLGFLRSQCAAIWMEDGDTTSCNVTNLRIGTANETLPSACRRSHFFTYSVSGNTGNTATFIATRCTGSNGKTPGLSSGTGNVNLTVDYQSGTDTWRSTGQW